ncbi:MAG: YqgE/AlgH family protein [Bacteroidota bacterium]
MSHPPAAGRLLVAHPMLGDPNFNRSVVLLCEHTVGAGSFGLVLTRTLEERMGELMPSLADFDGPVGQGGPVQLDTLHFVHRHGEQVSEAIEIHEAGVYWGGDIAAVEQLVLTGQTGPEQMRFFAGYAGWDDGQLQAEIEEGSWFVADLSLDLLFSTPPENLWRTVLRRMGGQYALLANFPADPRLN